MLDKLLSIVNTVLTNRGKNPVAEISANSHFRNDLGFDSLDLAELTVRIQADYEVDIFEDGIVNTVGEILHKIEHK